MDTYRSRRLTKAVVLLLVLALVLPLALVRCPDAVGPVPPQPLVLWHAFAEGSPEDVALRQAFGAIAAHGRPLPLQIYAVGAQLGAALSQALAAGRLPDLLLAPAEWAPLLHHAGLLHLVPLEETDNWLPAVLGAMSDGESLLGLPAFAATIGLGRSPTLAGLPWPDSPAALATQALAAAARGEGSLHWRIDDPYYSLPWYIAGGGELEPAGDWEGSPEVNEAAAYEWLAAVSSLAGSAADGFPPDLGTAWLEGRVSFAPLLPPQFLALQAVGGQPELGPLPGATPLLSVWALLMPRNGLEPPRDEVVEMAIRLRINDDEGLLYLSLLAGYLPPKIDLFQGELIAARGLEAYLDLALAAVPMPSGRLAAETWSVYEQALLELLAGAKANDVVTRLKERIAQL